MVLPEIAAVLGGAGNFLGQRKANQANARRLNTVLRQDNNQIGRFGALSAQLEAMSRLRMGDVRTGYKRANAALSRSQGAARSEILNSAAQASGYATQNVISRGLAGGGGTPTLDYAKRGVFYETARALSDSQGLLARQRASLEVGRGNAIAGIRGDQIGQSMSNFLTDDQLRRAKMEHILGVTSAAGDVSGGIGNLSSFVSSLFSNSGGGGSSDFEGDFSLGGGF